MANRTLKVIQKTLSASAVAVHNGQNSQGYASKLEGFIVQPSGGDVHFGGSGVTGVTNGFTVKDGEAVNIVGFLSRGSSEAYDLTQLYYVGGPWKLIIEENI